MNPYRDLTRRILRRYRQASPEHREAGLAWYPLAREACEQLAVEHGRSLPQVAAALAHLSPRVHWTRNLFLTEQLLAGAPKPPEALTRSWQLAQSALTLDDPLDSFGRRALKTRSFARAILGDRNAVVVDVWTARASGVSEDSIRTIAGYTVVADAYRRGARRVELAARDLQAVIWCSIRGTAS